MRRVIQTVFVSCFVFSATYAQTYQGGFMTDISTTLGPGAVRGVFPLEVAIGYTLPNRISLGAHTMTLLGGGAYDTPGRARGLGLYFDVTERTGMFLEGAGGPIVAARRLSSEPELFEWEGTGAYWKICWGHRARGGFSWGLQAASSVGVAFDAHSTAGQPQASRRVITNYWAYGIKFGYHFPNRRTLFTDWLRERSR